MIPQGLNLYTPFLCQGLKNGFTDNLGKILLYHMLSSTLFVSKLEQLNTVVSYLKMSEIQNGEAIKKTLTIDNADQSVMINQSSKH